MKRLETFEGLKKGDKIVIIENSNSHNYPLNRPLTLSRDGEGEKMRDAVKECSGNILKATDCEAGSVSLVDMKFRMAVLEEEEKELRAEIEFCERNGLTEFHSEAYKVQMAESK